MKFTVTPLFAVPLYQTVLDPLETDTLEFVKNLEYTRMPANNGDYTVDKRVLDLDELSSLRKRIQQNIDHFAHEVLDCNNSIDFQIQNSWINRHSKGDFAGSHRHNNSILSGVYYIDVEPDSGAIIFEKDKSHYNLWTDTIEIGFNYQLHQDQNKLNVYNSDAWGVIPRKNELAIFPSLCYHSVMENKNFKTRYSLAFNVFPRGHFGDSINTLKV